MPVTTSAPTPTPIEIVKHNPHATSWYLRVTIENAVAEIDSAEVRNADLDSWVVAVHPSWSSSPTYYEFYGSSQGTPFVEPLDMRINSTLGESLTTFGLIDGLDQAEGYTWDFGQNFVEFIINYNLPLCVCVVFVNASTISKVCFVLVHIVLIDHTNACIQLAKAQIFSNLVCCISFGLLRVLHCF